MGLKLVDGNEKPMPALTDIAARMRMMADHMDAGTHELGDIERMVFVTRTREGELAVGGFGLEPTFDEMIGMLTRAIHMVASMGKPEIKGVG